MNFLPASDLGGLVEMEISGREWAWWKHHVSVNLKAWETSQCPSCLHQIAPHYHVEPPDPWIREEPIPEQSATLQLVDSQNQFRPEEFPQCHDEKQWKRQKSMPC